jgi:hypothetical protein
MAAARYSDWTQLRGPVAAVAGLVSVLGYALLIAPVSSGVQFAGCFLVAMGLYVSVGIPLAWLPRYVVVISPDLRAELTSTKVTILDMASGQPPLVYS